MRMPPCGRPGGYPDGTRPYTFSQAPWNPHRSHLPATPKLTGDTGMTAYIIRRMLFLIPLLLGLSIVMFTIIRLAPGDPALAMMSPSAASNPQYLEQTRKNLGLDEPLPVQYLT